MRSALSAFIKCLQERVVLHPSAATLVASLDEGLEAVENTRIKGHLSRCAACRQRLEELQTGLRLYEDALAPLPANFSVEEGLGRLRGAIQTWNQQHPVPQGEDGPQPALSPGLWERLTSELSIYMGLPTARALLQTCNRPGVQPADLTAVIEPVVTGFFGRQTGAAVAANVVRICSCAQRAAAQSRPPL